jgi:translocation and assembly module TamB
MASETLKKPSRLFRTIRIGAATLVAALLLLVALAGWLAGTESGARMAFSMVASLAPGQLKAEGIHGRLVGPLRVDRLSLDSPDQLITLEKLTLDWRPQALLDGQLHIRALRVDRLALDRKTKEKTEPARLPENIALPFRLRADSVQVGNGEIRSGPATLVQLGPLAFNLDFDGMQYLLRLQQLAAKSGPAGAQTGSFAGSFKGEATLSTVKPYALRAQVSSDGQAVIREQTIGAAGRIDIEGSLAELGLATDLAIGESTIKGHAALRPFSEQILGASRVAARSVDLSRFRPDLPGTRLNIDLSVAENGAGDLAVSNAAAGLYSDRKLPLVDLRIGFQQRAAQIDFEKIAATLGSARRTAGVIAGNGRYADGNLALDLTLRAVNLQGLDQRMQRTQLAGKAGLRHASGRQEFTVNLTEPLNRQSIALSAHGVLAGTTLTVDRAELRLGRGRARASGHADLAGSQSFSASGDVTQFRLKDVGNFASIPDLFLNGGFSLRGARQPQLLADVTFAISDSRLGGHLLQGEGKAQLRADSVDISTFTLEAGANRLSIQGKLAQNEGQLSFNLSAPKLDQLGPGFGGKLEAKGVAQGSFNLPRIVAELNGAAIRLGEQLQIGSVQGKADIQVDRTEPFFIHGATAEAAIQGLRNGEQQLGAASVQLRFSPQPDAPLNLVVNGQGLVAGGLRADSFKATAAGTTAQHTLDLALSEPEQNWALNANGGLTALDKAPQWQGQIQRFNATGRFGAQLTAPAPLLVSQERVQLDRFRLDSTVAHLAIEQFMRDESGIVTRGRMERLQVGQLLKFSSKEPPVTTDLQLSADWDMRITDAPGGTLRIRRDSGDIVMRGSSPVALGLRNLEASAEVTGGQLALQLRADGAQLGVIDASGTIALQGGRRLAAAPDALVSGKIRIDVPSLGWISPLVSPTTIVQGRVQSVIAVDGTLSQPRLGGKISGNGLRFLSVETGVDLRQGVLESEFQGSQLLIHSLRFPSRDGQLTASGRIDLAQGQPDAQITVKAERFALLDRSDRKLSISGESQIVWRAAQPKITGAFNVDSGFVDISSTTMPRLSDDVVIVGKTEKKKTSERGLPAAIDVTVNLGKGIVLKGRGLDGLLAGQLRFASAPGEPLSARGTLQIVKGTFAAYGRELVIEHGVLRFNGPIDNPALDILAMRRGQQVEAGVAVLGTALSPRVTLVSEPPVSEAEKLSWLVLGHGLEASGEGDLGKLQSAAGALLSQGATAGVESQIARVFGLDQFSLGSTQQDGLEQRIVTLGKQISSRLYVSIEQGLQTASSVLHMRYALSSKLTLEAEAGTRSALSLFYNISFD